MSEKSKKPEGYGDIFVFVPLENQIIRIAEGSGDNLLPEDVAEGYVDYIYYEQFELGCEIENVDVGECFLKELFQHKYKCTADCIQDVLDMVYGNPELEYMILA